LLVLAVLVPGTACAQGWPERPIRLVVPFPAGGAVDIVARLVMQRLAELPALRAQAVVVENRAGASGSIGSEGVARASPDGYTLLLGTGSTHGTNPAVMARLPYDPIEDFAPVILMANTPYLLLVHPSVPARSLPELLALARAQPGRLHYASYGPGSSNHLATERLRALTGVDLVHVPYKGGAPAVAALVAGEIQMLLDVWVSSGPHVRAGRLRLLATAADQRASSAPDTPTFTEAGLAGFQAGTFYGVFAPAGTPAERVALLNRAINQVIAEPETRQRLLAQGAEPLGGAPGLLSARVRDEVLTWRALVKDRRLSFD
jgi:tripartite-type tricarboxylate transporter receptor subunit TctC